MGTARIEFLILITRKAIFSVVLCLLTVGMAFGQGPRVPSNMEFANIKLKLSEKARRDIQADVDA